MSEVFCVQFNSERSKFCSFGKAISVTSISIDAAIFRNVTSTYETGLHYSSFFVVILSYLTLNIQGVSSEDPIG